MIKDIKNNVFWLPLAILIIHSADEIITGFPHWATAHFGTTTVNFFIYSHIFLVLLVAAIAYLATKRSVFWKLLAAIAITQFAVNALFHILSSILFSEITPGILSATFVSLPLSYIFFRTVLTRKLLSEQQFVLSLTLGLVCALLIIASLWLDGI